MIKKSQVFAAARADTIGTLLNVVTAEFAPSYNAEHSCIIREWEEAQEYAMQQPDSARNKLIELASASKQAKILNLNLKRQEFMQSLQSRFRMELLKKKDELGGELKTEVEHGRRVEKVLFSDGSKAKVPAKIFVDWSQFAR